ncbi:hypothetical protein INR49_018514 [Caranx melampygus]|nr:hypothetical protein INR49_018514 [Caranx melampygus]
MAVFISTLLLLFIVAVGITPIISQTELSNKNTSPSAGLFSTGEPMCYDWGESSEGAVSVLEGQVGWLSCPLFSHPSVYNYTSTQSAGHNLFWYRLPDGHDVEQPITYSSQFSKDRERLWLQPAVARDSGQYICMLRNKSSCSKIAMRLKVVKLDEVARQPSCQAPVAMVTTNVIIPLQEGKTLECPNIQDATKMADSQPSVTWYHVRTDGMRCYQYPFWNTDRQQKGTSLQFYVMTDIYQGVYVCTVNYLRKGAKLNFTRSINVTAVTPSKLPKEPSILHPTLHQVFIVKQDTDVRLVCRALFPYLDSPGRSGGQLMGNRLINLPTSASTQATD